MVRHPNVVRERSVLLGADTSHISSPPQTQTFLHHPMCGRSRATSEQSFPKCLHELTQLFEDFRELSHPLFNPLQPFSFYQFTCPYLQVLHSPFRGILCVTEPSSGLLRAPPQGLPRSCGWLRKSFSEGSLKKTPLN